MKNQSFLSAIFRSFLVFVIRFLIACILFMPLGLLYEILPTAGTVTIMFLQLIAVILFLSFLCYRKRIKNEEAEAIFKESIVTTRFSRTALYNKSFNTYKTQILADTLVFSVFIISFVISIAYSSSSPLMLNIVVSILTIIIFVLPFFFLDIYLWYKCVKKWFKEYADWEKEKEEINKLKNY